MDFNFDELVAENPPPPNDDWLSKAERRARKNARRLMRKADAAHERRLSAADAVHRFHEGWYIVDLMHYANAHEFRHCPGCDRWYSKTRPTLDY